MLDYRDPSTRKQIASFLIKIAKKIELDEEFAQIFFEEMKETPKKKKTNNGNKEEPIKLDVFGMYQNQGSDGLESFLHTLEVQELRKIVLDNGFDPAQKVRRWRKKDKIITFIIESVSKLMAKGGAFMRF